MWIDDWVKGARRPTLIRASWWHSHRQGGWDNLNGRVLLHKKQTRYGWKAGFTCLFTNSSHLPHIEAQMFPCLLFAEEHPWIQSKAWTILNSEHTEALANESYYYNIYLYPIIKSSLFPLTTLWFKGAGETVGRERMVELRELRYSLLLNKNTKSNQHQRWNVIILLLCFW